MRKVLLASLLLVAAAMAHAELPVPNLIPQAAGFFGEEYLKHPGFNYFIADLIGKGQVAYKDFVFKAKDRRLMLSQFEFQDLDLCGEEMRAAFELRKKLPDGTSAMEVRVVPEAGSPMQFPVEINGEYSLRVWTWGHKDCPGPELWFWIE